MERGYGPIYIYMHIYMYVYILQWQERGVVGGWGWGFFEPLLIIKADVTLVVDYRSQRRGFHSPKLQCAHTVVVEVQYSLSRKVYVDLG